MTGITGWLAIGQMIPADLAHVLLVLVLVWLWRLDQRLGTLAQSIVRLESRLIGDAPAPQRSITIPLRPATDARNKAAGRGS